jgi:glycosyltransferase involved in cell wall biosynthesis
MMLLEGTYPYVRGGVSSWVDQIIRGCPDKTFALVFLGGQSDMYGEMTYDMPDNVISLDHHYLLDDGERFPKPKAGDGIPEHFELWQNIIQYFQDPSEAVPKEFLREFFQLLIDGSFSLSDFLYTRNSWTVLQNIYLKHSTEPSFIDFFWTYRTIYQPLFKMAALVKRLPEAKMLHSVSTGYAGFLAAVISLLRQIPYLLTEHGIYTKERNIDLSQATWITDPDASASSQLQYNMSYVRKMWMRFFQQLGRISYDNADKIISLYEYNQLRQIRDGAEKERTFVIPNGIDIDHFSKAREQHPRVPIPVAALIGRVVPIKDIKTFIRAIKQASVRTPGLQGWIVGPIDESPEYVDECKLLVSSLGLDKQIKFTGMQNLLDILPQVGLVVLTSISEAQPLVLLEAMAAGVPVVASDVGSCAAIINGGVPNDKALGCAGRLTPIANGYATATAISDMLSDPDLWQQCRQSGIERAEKFYTRPAMLAAYQSLYQEMSG